MNDLLEQLSKYQYHPEELVIILLILVNLILSVILFRTLLHRNKYQVDVKFTTEEEEDEENDVKS